MSFFSDLDKAMHRRDKFKSFGLVSDKTLAIARDPLNIFGGQTRAEKIKVPKAPTIDEAAKNRDEFDRIRRRRGILATIFSNNASSTPAVATTTLLGG